MENDTYPKSGNANRFFTRLTYAVGMKRDSQRDGFTLLELRSFWPDTVGTSFNGGATWFCGSYTATRNEVWFGGAAINAPLGANNGAISGASYLTGQAAFAIDTKIDDGLPASGYVVAPYYSATTWLTNGVACSPTYQGTVIYNVAAVGRSGGLVFMDDF